MSIEKIKQNLMRELEFDELLKQLRNVSFEEGRKLIMSKYSNLEENINFDKQNEICDLDFMFDGEAVITYTTTYIDTDEEVVIDYENGYWNIQGNRY